MGTISPPDTAEPVNIRGFLQRKVSRFRLYPRQWLMTAGYSNPSTEASLSRSMSGPPLGPMLPSSILPSSTFGEFRDAARDVGRQRRRNPAYSRRENKVRVRRATTLLPSIQDPGSSQVLDVSGSIDSLAAQSNSSYSGSRSPYPSSSSVHGTYGATLARRVALVQYQVIVLTAIQLYIWALHARLPNHRAAFVYCVRCFPSLSSDLADELTVAIVALMVRCPPTSLSYLAAARAHQAQIQLCWSKPRRLSAGNMAATAEPFRLSAICFGTNAKRVGRLPNQCVTGAVPNSRGKPLAMDIWHMTNAKADDPPRTRG